MDDHQYTPEEIAAAVEEMTCHKCGGSGWVFAIELENYYGENPSTDKTKYSCDVYDCKERRALIFAAKQYGVMLDAATRLLENANGHYMSAEDMYGLQCACGIFDTDLSGSPAPEKGDGNV